MDSRTSKQNYYLDIADSVLERSTCLRRKYGAIIVRADEIISTGYNGAPRGRRNCSDLGVCTRETLNIPSGERYELCRSVHAEANAIISASRRDMIGATLYLVGRDARTDELLSDAMSCSMCKRQIINAGIERVVIRTAPSEYRTIMVSDWIENDDSIFMTLVSEYYIVRIYSISGARAGLAARAPGMIFCYSPVIPARPCPHRGR